MIEASEDTATAPTDKPAGKAGGKRKLILIGAGAAVLLIGGGGGAYMMTGTKAAAAHGKESPAAEEAPAEEASGEEGGEGGGHGGVPGNEPLDVPPILVNLRTADGAAHFLKLHIMIVPGKATTSEELKKQLPELIDAYQPFLRELHPEDLAGSAAVYRIKEELMLRAAATLGKDQVKDVLIQDLIQQ